VNLRDPSGLSAIDASFYDGIGGGIKISWDSTGFSFCAEIGVGFGGGVTVDPFEAIDKTSTRAVEEIGLHVGPISARLKGELSKCGLTVEVKRCLGPFCLKGDSDNHRGGEIGGEFKNLGKDWKEAFKEAGPPKIEAKLALKSCRQHLW